MVKEASEFSWKEIPLGAICLDPGSSREYKTGTWRSTRPVVDTEKCIKCGLCWLYCPEGCIEKDKYGYFHADLDFCKGCGICAKECWTQCIKMVEEE
jgi:pyruvate ferredoxin oxidoreductase delta subunit